MSNPLDTRVRLPRLGDKSVQNLNQCASCRYWEPITNRKRDRAKIGSCKMYRWYSAHILQRSAGGTVIRSYNHVCSMHEQATL